MRKRKGDKGRTEGGRGEREDWRKRGKIGGREGGLEEGREDWRED